MILTGVDGEKRVSVNTSLLKKKWEPSHKEGRRIYVIPSNLSHVKVSQPPVEDIRELRKAMEIEIEEKFPGARWDLRVENGLMCLCVFRDFTIPGDAYALDPEVFSLARAGRANGFEDGFILDLGQRKSTLVEVKGGDLISYRVVLKGAEFIDRNVSKKRETDLETAKRLRLEEGLENEDVRESFEEILKAFGKEIKDDLFLSGGLSRIKGIRSLFREFSTNRFVPPEMTSAFGSALKYALPDCSPDFREEEVSKRDLRKTTYILASSVLIGLASIIGTEMITDHLRKEIRKEEKTLFREKFPNLPSVAIRDQLKAMSSENKYQLTGKLIELSRSLGKGITLYSIEYAKGVLKLKGEAEERSKLDPLKPKSVKKTPKGGWEFEVELR